MLVSFVSQLKAHYEMGNKSQPFNVFNKVHFAKEKYQSL